MDASPLHYRDFEDRDTAARGKLRSIHALVLEPENAQIAVYEGKRDERIAVYRDFLANHAGMQILTPREYDDVQRIRDGIYRHELARSILEAAGRSEVTITWTDETTGLPCKARIDRLHDGGVFVADLKTYGSSDPRVIARRAAQLFAHVQAVHYTAGVGAAFGIPVTEIRYVLICVEDRAPFDVAVLELENDNALALGRHERDRFMARLAECVTRDEWPGRCPDMVALELPAWADPLLAEEPNVDLTGAS